MPNHTELRSRQPAPALLAQLLCVVICLFPLLAAAEEPAPKPREATPEQLEAIAQYRKLTSLESKENVKHIPTPFPDYRADAMRGTFRSDLVPAVAITSWNSRIEDAPPQEQGKFTVRSSHKVGHPVSSLVSFFLKLAPEEIEGDSALCELALTGDWVIRDSASAKELIPQLNELLMKNCQPPIRLRFDEAERVVVVAKGKYLFRPIANRTTVEVYGNAPRANGFGGGGSGGIDKFIAAVGRHIQHRAIYESDERKITEDQLHPPAGIRGANAQPFKMPEQIRWNFEQLRFPKGHSPTAEEKEEYSARVLQHVAEQTGLTFSAEPRKVRVLFIEKAD